MFGAVLEQAGFRNLETADGHRGGIVQKKLDDKVGFSFLQD